MKKRILSMVLCLIMLFSIVSTFNLEAFALESTGNAKMDAFINDSRFTDGVSWGDRGPYLSSWGSLQCCAYVADFVYYCFGKSGPKTGENFKSAWDIRAGDVISVGGENGGGHWFAVLKRDGNRLYVAEGNYAKRVRIGWNYTITGDKTISGTNYSFSNGWHYLDPAPSEYSLDVNTNVDGVEYKSGYDGVSFDVRQNGNIIKTGVNDFYQQCKAGQEWAVINISIPSKYVLTGSMDGYGNYYSSSLNENTVVKLCLTTPTLVKTATLNGNKYEFYNVSTRWFSANEFAKAKGGHLATITSQEEQDFIADNNTVGFCWLGATDIDTEGSWKWVTGENFTYSNWEVSEPNNCEPGEHFLMIYNGGKWNDDHYYNSDMKGFIVEYDHAYHIWNNGSVTKSATCTATGTKKYTCTVCGETKTETIAALGHDYIMTEISATCTTASYLQYKCSRCGDTYKKESSGSYVYGEWSTTQPSVSGNTTVETKTQYRYKNGTTGYTDWVKTNSGTHYYFSRPSGFKSSAYTNFASAPLSSSETETSKRVVESAQHNSYIYWHWASPTSYGVGTNCFIGSYEGEPGNGSYQPFTVWEAFENGSDLTEATSDSCCRVQGHSSYSYWWFKTETFKQSYTDYMRSTTTNWSDWSAWSDTAVTASSTNQVETRTLYRTKTPVTGAAALGHKWDSGKVTKAPTSTSDGVKTYTCTVCGATKTETIAKQPLDASCVTLSKTSFTYNSKVQKPTVTVKNSAGTTLTNGTDYTVTYSEGCKYPGTYTVTVTGIGSSFTGAVTKTFTIAKQSLAASGVTLSKTSFTYNSKVQKPTVTVKNAAGTTLTEGTSYKVTYSADCKYPGTYTVTVTGIGSSFTGTVTKTFTIAKQPLAASRVTLSQTSFTYNSKVQKPTVTVKNAAGTTLTEGTSYKVTYSEGCKTPGTYTVTVTGIGSSFTGTVTKTFTIAKQPLSASRVTLSQTSFTYNSKVQKPTVTVKNAAGTTLTEGTSYKVTYSADCKYPGTYTVTVTGIGSSFTGTVTKTFTIAKQPLSASRVTLSQTSFTYNGKIQQPTVTVKNAAGTTLTEGTSYTVAYSSGCKAKGTYTVVIIGSGYFTGTITKTFTIK